jgi:hypothetical protein
MKQGDKHYFVVCVDNTGYVASLEPRKIYQCVPDEMAKKHHQVRIIDESGEDYLFPVRLFIAVDLPKNVEDAIMIAA